jgi:hypothetical protein
MTGSRYVPTAAIRDAVKGREAEVLHALEIDWRCGNPHIRCPYPTHDDSNPSWRWDKKKARAFCSCVTGSHSIFDIVMAREGGDFASAKIRVAELLGRSDLIREQRAGSGGRYQGSDAESLLNAPDTDREDELPIAYLAHRLGVTVGDLPRPSTRTVGLKGLAYFDPSPKGSTAKPKRVGHFPCAVFGTISVDGRTHAHRVYLAPAGVGKAELGVGPDGQPRPQKKSATIGDEISRAGCAVIWGDPERAPKLLLAEGIETAAAIAYCFREEIEAGETVVAAAISVAGLEAFKPYPATRQVIVCADRDESGGADGRKASKRGEKAAREFGLRNHETVEVCIVLPGAPGETVDWLDVLRRDGPLAIQLAYGFQATKFVPTEEETERLSQSRTNTAQLHEIAEKYPLPNLDNLNLTYARTAAGKIKVHKVLGFTTDPVTGLVQPLRIAVATPFGVPARLRHANQQDAYGLRCTVEDMKGQSRAIDFDRGDLAKMNAADIRAKLYAAGLRTEGDGEQVAVQCLKAADPEHEIVVYHRTGWQDVEAADGPIFVCPSGEVVGAAGGIELASVARLDPDVAASGTLEGWRSAVEAAVLVPGCPHWILGAIAGFVGPLISLTGLDTCGINLSGQSSSGKSTAQRLAVSAWSTPDLKRRGLAQSARVTANAMEALAQRATGTVLSLDELALVTGKELAPAIYMIAGGAGKQRMGADATLRTGYSWLTFAIVSCECSLEEKIRAEGGEWRAGMAVRFVDIDVAEVNRRVDNDTFRQIDKINHNYGHAGPAFIRGLIEQGLHSQTQEITDRVVRTAHKLAGENADSAQLRAALPFAWLLIAGRLATAFKLLPEHTKVEQAVGWAWERFTKSTDALALDPETQALANLSRYIAERWGATIQSVEPSFSTINREQVGWYDQDTVYVPTARIGEATGNVMKASNVGAMLNRRGLLSKKPGPDRYTIPYVPKVGRVSCFALRRDEFGRSDRLEDAFKEAADD